MAAFRHKSDLKSSFPKEHSYQPGMKASHILGLKVLTALSTFSRPAVAKQSANWAIDSETCYRRPFAPLEVQRALNIAKHVVNNLADGNYDATIQNFIQVLFNQAPDGVGLEWVQDVFAGEGPENLPGIANFDNKVDDDEVEAGDLVAAPLGRGHASLRL